MVIVPLAVQLKVVEAHERPLVEVVQHCLALPGLGVDGCQVCRLVWAPVCHHMQLAILVYAAVYVEGGRVCPDLGQVVGPDVQDVLPVMSAVHASRRTPLYKEEQRLLRDVARGLVHLEGELLQL